MSLPQEFRGVLGAEVGDRVTVTAVSQPDGSGARVIVEKAKKGE